MKKQANGDTVLDWQLLDPEILLDLDYKLLDFFKKYPKVERSRISTHGHLIGLDSMTKEQSNEFFKICNTHREKWNLK